MTSSVCYVASAVVLAVLAPGPAATGDGVRARPTPIQPPEKPVVFNVDGNYGTLGFKGTVERFDLGGEYEYRPHISITFLPNEQTNRTPIANLVMVRLVATKPGPERDRAILLSSESESIAVFLSQDGETKTMPDVVFRLPKSIVAEAAHVVLGVTDMRLLWPIPVELK